MPNASKNRRFLIFQPISFYHSASFDCGDQSSIITRNGPISERQTDFTCNAGYIALRQVILLFPGQVLHHQRHIPRQTI